MDLSQAEVSQIVCEVWSSMLGLSVEPSDVPSDPENPVCALAGSVGVSGEADCLITVQMSEGGAENYAAAMFGMGQDELETEMVTDAAGELTNMVGGNIKCLLPEPSQLSLPVVAKGTPPTLSVPGASRLITADFTSEGHPITVTVWGRE